MTIRDSPGASTACRHGPETARFAALSAVFLSGASSLKAAKMSGLSPTEVAREAGAFAAFFENVCATFDGVDGYNHERAAQVAAAREALAIHDPDGRMIRIYCESPSSKGFL